MNMRGKKDFFGFLRSNLFKKTAILRYFIEIIGEKPFFVLKKFVKNGKKW